MPVRRVHRPTVTIVDAAASRVLDPDYATYRSRQSGNLMTRLRRQGWMVRWVPAEESRRAVLRAALDDTDALVLGGGEDIDPFRYGGRPGYVRESAHLPLADGRQMTLVRLAARRRIPVLGICRGMQIINVAFGGTLIPDLGEGTIHENFGAPLANAISLHQVQILGGSRLGSALSSGVPLVVASGHHQAVGRPGAGLRVVATAPDGVAEAIEHESLPVFGVQWHPESAAQGVAQLDALSSLLRRAR